MNVANSLKKVECNENYREIINALENESEIAIELKKTWNKITICKKYNKDSWYQKIS